MSPRCAVCSIPLLVKPMRSLSLRFLSRTRHMSSQTRPRPHTTSGRYTLPSMQTERVVALVYGEEEMGRQVYTYTMHTKWTKLMLQYPEAWAANIDISSFLSSLSGSLDSSSLCCDSFPVLCFRLSLVFSLLWATVPNALTMEDSTLRLNCVRSLMIWRVKNTIRYQNSIWSTVRVSITPYSSPVRKNGSCMNMYSEYLISLQLRQRKTLKMQTKIGNTQQNPWLLPMRTNSAQSAGMTTKPHTMVVTSTGMNSSLILLCQLKMSTEKQKTRMAGYVRIWIRKQKLATTTAPTTPIIMLVLDQGMTDAISPITNRSKKKGKLVSWMRYMSPILTAQARATSAPQGSNLNQNLLRVKLSLLIGSTCLPASPMYCSTTWFIFSTLLPCLLACCFLWECRFLEDCFPLDNSLDYRLRLFCSSSSWVLNMFMSFLLCPRVGSSISMVLLVDDAELQNRQVILPIYYMPAHQYISAYYINHITRHTTCPPPARTASLFFTPPLQGHAPNLEPQCRIPVRVLQFCGNRLHS